MKLPKKTALFYVPARVEVEVDVIELPDSLIDQAMGVTWWSDPAINPALAAMEIDRYWNWADLVIERNDRILASRKLPVDRIVYEGVEYTPMELEAARVSMLLTK